MYLIELRTSLPSNPTMTGLEATERMISITKTEDLPVEESKSLKSRKPLLSYAQLLLKSSFVSRFLSYGYFLQVTQDQGLLMLEEISDTTESIAL